LVVVRLRFWNHAEPQVTFGRKLELPKEFFGLVSFSFKRKSFSVGFGLTRFNCFPSCRVFGEEFGVRLEGRL